MKLEIDCMDRWIISDLLGKTKESESTVSTSYNVPGGFRLTYQGTIFRASIDSPYTVKFLIEIIKDVGVALFASWLYDKLKERAKEIRIDSEKVSIEIDSIKMILERKIIRK